MTNPTHICTNASAALAYLQSHPLPGIIVLDLRMPGMDGFGLLRTIRANPEWKDVVIIVLSGSDTLEEMDEAYRLGASSFFRKPVSFNDLRYLVAGIRKQWLDGR